MPAGMLPITFKFKGETKVSMKRILFVCVGNANRSQMAEAFARMHGASYAEVYSAGSRPYGIINSKSVAAMSEPGYDLTNHLSKSLTEIPDVEFDFVATMGRGDVCPWFVPGDARIGASYKKI